VKPSSSQRPWRSRAENLKIPATTKTETASSLRRL